jgi:hypothetical protein
VKAIVAIILTGMIGGSAVAADLKLKCAGELPDGPFPARPISIEFGISISGSEFTLHADPKYGMRGGPVIFKETDPIIVIFESVEQIRRPGQEAEARFAGMFYRKTAAIFIEWRDNEKRFLSGRCELLMGSRSTVLPKPT